MSTPMPTVVPPATPTLFPTPEATLINLGIPDDLSWQLASQSISMWNMIPVAAILIIQGMILMGILAIGMKRIFKAMGNLKEKLASK